MPKHNDTDIYPFNPVLDSGDGLFGFSVKNGKKSKNFKLEHLRYFILQGLDASNNGFLVNNGYTLVGNTLTILAGWQWYLNGMLFTNEEDVEFTLEYTAEGFVRTDSVYANSSNSFGIMSGPEGETISAPPTIPINTLLAFSLNIFDAAIEVGPEPVLGSVYLKKEYHRAQIYNDSGANLVLPLNHLGYSNIYLEGTIESVDGFNLSELIANPAIAEYPHEGKPFRIYNRTTGPVTLNHEISNPIFFQFRNAENFVIPVGESVELVNLSGSLVDVDKSFTTTDDVNGLQAELDLKLDIADYNDRYKGKYTSLPNLQAAHPTAEDGDTAVVDAGPGTNALEYIWDTNEGWVQGNSVGATTTDALPEGATNLYFTTAKVLATLLTGISFATGGAIVSTDTILQAFGKIQKQINDLSGVFVPQTRTITFRGVTQDLSANRDFSEKLITNASVSGTYNIDWSVGDVWRLTLVGATTLTFSNLPASGFTDTKTLNINGNQTLAYPAGFTGFITGAYEGAATLNTLTVQFIGASEYKVAIIQPD